eukprot:1138167-Pelagomonas_calceolata.AAC.2
MKPKQQPAAMLGGKGLDKETRKFNACTSIPLRLLALAFHSIPMLHVQKKCSVKGLMNKRLGKGPVNLTSPYNP